MQKLITQEVYSLKNPGSSSSASEDGEDGIEEGEDETDALLQLKEKQAELLRKQIIGTKVIQ
jgi:hypothetical protein